jgi:hypothetical protein
VWYFGEDTKEYEEGEVVSTKGSWEAGVDGAKPGIIMQGEPKVGQTYRQEYYKGEAEDMAKVIRSNKSLTVPYGSFDHVLVTKEWTPLEPSYHEHKYYAPGVGQVYGGGLRTGRREDWVREAPPPSGCGGAQKPSSGRSWELIGTALKFAIGGGVQGDPQHPGSASLLSSKKAISGSPCPSSPQSA